MNRSTHTWGAGGPKALTIAHLTTTLTVLLLTALSAVAPQSPVQFYLPGKEMFS